MLLVVLEHDRGGLGEPAREALTFGRTLAAKLGSDMHAVVIGAGATGGLDSLVAEAGAHGAALVYTVDHEVLGDFGPEVWGESIVQVIRATDPGAVLACGSERGNEVMAQAAARLDAPFVANCTDITPPTGGGVGVVDDSHPVGRVAAGGRHPEGRHRSALLRSALGRVLARRACARVPAGGAAGRRRAGPRAGPDRREGSGRAGSGCHLAHRAGGGRRWPGRGLAEGFAPLEELAELLGGRVGCSRAVTNNGWRPHSDQVGQTGTRIAPEIYIASGISGAIQHWVGAMGSKHILAINIDPEANMVVKANWAVIGDLHQVIPAISEEVRRRRS